MVDGGAAGARCGDAELENLEDDGDPADAALSTMDEHADPLHQLQQRERHAALNAGFDALEERERRLMELIYQHGVSHRDAAARLGVSASRVSRMHEEIVVKLRRRLRDW
jgi:RNA polymerase sigma-B factor